MIPKIPIIFARAVILLTITSMLAACVPSSSAPQVIPISIANRPPLPDSSGLPRRTENPQPEIVAPVIVPEVEQGQDATNSKAAADGPATGAQTKPASALASVIEPVIEPVIAPTPVPPTPPPSPTPETIDGPVTVAVDPALPYAFNAPIQTALESIDTLETSTGAQPLNRVDQVDQAGARIGLAGLIAPGFTLWERYYAVVVPFDTLRDDISIEELRVRWSEHGRNLVITPDVMLLDVALGEGSAPLVDPADLLGVLLADRDVIAVVPFDQLQPTLKVLSVDGVNVLNNYLQAGTYPLGVAVKVDGVGASLIGPRLLGVLQPTSNRQRARLTTLVMTGVTAMARATAAVMERKGYDYPALVIGPTLAQADITHISNEIPFLDDCVVRNFENNLQLCSHTNYWAALAASGADIIGLSGNHVNDFGRTGATRSLTWYKENKIPVYGSGFSPDEACAPLIWSDGRNRFAFIAALAFGPEFAWVNESEPGACYYYEHKERILASIRSLAQQVDIVSVELQFEESYNPWPLPGQITEFRELRAAGAEIVTGVQSHVPQAMEPYGAHEPGGNGIIVYGLGNLYFDQMWSWAVRTELYARHTIYDGRVISTEILTGVLEDFAQPRWATAAERANLLASIFAAAPAKP